MTPGRPKVLVVSTNAWREDSGITTLMDLFRGWDAECLAQVYTRSVLPSTKVCGRFFRVSEDSMIRSILRRGVDTGTEVTCASEGDLGTGSEAVPEARRYRLGHAFVLTIARELVWLLGVWRTPALNRFLEDFDPDVLFLPIYPTIYMGRIQHYVLKKTGARAVCYIADDNFTYRPCGFDPLKIAHRFFLRRTIRKVVGACDESFAIVPKLKQEFDLVFGVHSQLLTRGIDFPSVGLARREVHSPIRLLYTGKLILDRWKSLALIVRALGHVNREQVRAVLEIYSTDTPTRSQRRVLESAGSHFRGGVPASAVQSLQADADILVFVEALSGRYRNAARLSFSTKLTDYMRSGGCILAVGPRDSGPIEYLRSEDAAVCASSEAEVSGELRGLLATPLRIIEYGQRALECGRRNHDEVSVRQRLHDSLMRVSRSSTRHS